MSFVLLMVVIFICTIINLYSINFVYRNTAPTIVFLLVLSMLSSWIAGLLIGIFMQTCPIITP